VAEKFTLWFFDVAIAAIENEHVFFGESHQSSINSSSKPTAWSNPATMILQTGLFSWEVLNE
jgi:hypothetical protein